MVAAPGGMNSTFAGHVLVWLELCVIIGVSVVARMRLILRPESYLYAIDDATSQTYALVSCYNESILIQPLNTTNSSQTLFTTAIS